MFKSFIKEQKTKYNYEKLAHLVQETNLPRENVCLYGIINDSNNISKNIYNLTQITFQVIDETHNYLNTNNLLSATITAVENFVPYFLRLGDIIRVHRGKLSGYNDQRKIHLSKGGSWTIFSGEERDDFEPVFKSSNKYTFEEHDETIIKKLRKFAKVYFHDEKVFKFNFNYLSIKMNEDYSKNCLVLIKERIETQDTILFKVYDSKSIFDMNLDKEKYRYILIDDVLILKKIKTEKDQIIFNQNSVVLCVPDSFYLHKNLKMTIQDNQMNDESEIHIDAKDIDFIITQTQQFEGKTENEIFENELKGVLENRKRFIVQTINPLSTKINLNQIDANKITNYTSFNIDLKVVAMSPQDEREFVKVYCKECHQFFSTKDYNIINSERTNILCRNENCKARTCQLIYHIIFHCICDYNSTTVYNFILSTYSEEHEQIKGLNFFKNILPEDLYKNQVLLSEFKQIKLEMMTFLNCINVNAELIKSFQSAKSKTQIFFRIIGEY